MTLLSSHGAAPDGGAPDGVAPHEAAPRYVLYARAAATADPAEADWQIASQLAEGQATVARLGGVVLGTYTEIGSGLAGLQDRAELKRAVDIVVGGRAQALVCLNPTRLARDPEVLRMVQARLHRPGQIIYVRQSRAASAPQQP